MFALQGKEPGSPVFPGDSSSIFAIGGVRRYFRVRSGDLLLINGKMVVHGTVHNPDPTAIGVAHGNALFTKEHDLVPSHQWELGLEEMAAEGEEPCLVPMGFGKAVADTAQQKLQRLLRPDLADGPAVRAAVDIGLPRRSPRLVDSAHGAECKRRRR